MKCKACEGNGDIVTETHFKGSTNPICRRETCYECRGTGEVDVTFWQGVMYTIIFFIALIAVGNAIEVILRWFGA
jgi:hypothetical protein